MLLRRKESWRDVPERMDRLAPFLQNVVRDASQRVRGRLTVATQQQVKQGNMRMVAAAQVINIMSNDL